MKKIKLINKTAILLLTVSFVACGDGSSSSDGNASANLTSSDMSAKEFITIIRNEDRTNCEIVKENIRTFGTFIRPVVSIESNDITCADYGRVDRKCSVTDLEIDGTIACVTGHDGLI